MTREIKFRAWDSVERLMYYFDFYDIEKPSHLGGQILRMCGDGIERYFPLHRQPVMQFTGLKDKNGKEVYEGDIVDYAGLKPLRIEWRGVGFVAPLMPFENSDPIYLGQEGFTMFAEVIGNIYETPELLR